MLDILLKGKILMRRGIYEGTSCIHYSFQLRMIDMLSLIVLLLK